MEPINLNSPLTFSNSFKFPLQSEQSKREVVTGALWLFVPGIGWLMNMGHRIIMTHQMMKGCDAWPAWGDNKALLKHGWITFLGMVEYHSPSVILQIIAWQMNCTWLHWVASLLWIIASVAVPGYMSHYCLKLDPSEIFNPFKALSRVIQGGRLYWKAWGIALSALCLSFLGLIGLGVGFFFTSVWFWQVAGFSFATVFSQKFELQEEPARSGGF